MDDAFATRLREICLNEAWAGVDINLTQNRVPRVNESMRCIRRDDDNAAGSHFAGFITDRDGGAAFKRERDLDVRMGVQRRALPGLRIDDVGRERRALLFAYKFIGHSNKRQLLEIEKAHDGNYLKYRA
jgi:hypothetical protein